MDLEVQAQQAFEQKRYEEASELYGQIIDQKGSSEPYLFNSRGTALFLWAQQSLNGSDHKQKQKSTLENALTFLSKAIQLDENDRDAIFKVGVIQFLTDRNTEAQDSFHKCIETGWQCAEAYFYTGSIYLKRKDYASAIKYYQISEDYLKEKVIEEEGQDPFRNVLDLYLSIATAYIRLKLVDETAKYLKLAESIDKDSPKLEYLKGKLSLLRSDSQTAETQFQSALKKNPSYVEAAIQLSRIWTDQNKKDQALKLLEDIQKYDTTGTKPLVAKGSLYGQSQQWDLALKNFDEAIKRNKDNVCAYRRKGEMLHQQGRTKDALTTLEKGEHVNPKDTKTLVAMAGVLSDLQRYDEAIKKCDKAIEQDPNRVEAYNQKGSAHKNKNELDKALVTYEKAVSKDQNNIIGVIGKVQTESLLGKEDDTINDLNKLNELIKKPQANKMIKEEKIKDAQIHISSVLQMEVNFASKAVVFKGLQDDKYLPTDQQKVYLDYIKLRQEKAKIHDEKLNQIIKGTNTSTDTDKQTQNILERLDKLSQELIQLRNQNNTLKNQFNQQQEQIEDLKNDQKQIWSVLKLSGTYDKARVQQWFIDNAGSDKYNYAKAFYWTLLNYTNAYRAAWTGVLSNNQGHTESGNQANFVNYTKKALSYGEDLASGSGVPYLGNIFKVLDYVIDSVYSDVKSKRYTDRIRSINKIIADNETAHIAEDVSLVIAKAGQQIADFKGKDIINDYDVPVTKNAITRVYQFFQEQIDIVKQMALGKDITLYQSVGGTVALKDVTTVIAYMQLHYAEIIKKSKTDPLDKQIADIIIGKKVEEMMKKTKIDTKAKFDSKEFKLDWDADKDMTAQDIEHEDPERSSSCCIIM